MGTMLRIPLPRFHFAASRLGRVTLIGLSLLLAVVGIIAALLAMSSDAPIARKYEAKAALQKARDAGADSLAAAPWPAAQEAFSAGLRDMALQVQRLPWNRTYGKSEALFDTAIRRAQLASALTRHQRDEARDLTRQLLARADGGFDQMEWISGYIPPRSLIHSDIRKAYVSYTEAKTLLAKGEYVGAARAARDANAGIDSAYTRFSRFIQSANDPERSARYVLWVRDTLSWSDSNNSRAIIVDKMRRTLSLIVNGRRDRVYHAELGVNGTLDKVVSGDRATPEGKYRITEKRGLRQTRWYKALLLNYPNEDDLRQFDLARKRGQISRRARPGGLIEIHGEGGRGGDWTDGCVALNNRDIDDLFDRVSVGTPVTIVGFESGMAIGVTDSTSRTASRRGAPARVSAGAGGMQ